MAAPTYHVRALVLRKTKLGEADLILTLLAQDGSQLRAVAKGARKPQSSFSSRLELYCVVDLLCAKGRTLDIVKEARLVEGVESLRYDVLRATAAAPLVELLAKMSQPGLENAVLFDSSCAALAALSSCPYEALPSITAAHLLKILAYCGLRPSFDVCVGCGCSVGVSSCEVPMSFAEGGVACASCRAGVDSQLVPAESVAWGRALLGARFAQIAADPPDYDVSFGVLRLSQGLIHAHVGSKLKALEFMLSCGLYV